MEAKEQAMTILKSKRAIVFGAGGSVGAAVPSEFAAEGAEVFLAGRTRSSVEAAASRITASGGRAEAAVVNALEASAVDRYVDDIARGGGVDIVFNAVGPLIAEYG